MQRTTEMENNELMEEVLEDAIRRLLDIRGG